MSHLDGQKFYGVTVAIVIDNQDPEGLGRLKVGIAAFSQSSVEIWAHFMTPMSGNEAGMFFLPDKDDQVLVAFEHGELSRPYVLGALWSSQNKPPEKNDDGKNDVKIIKTRSGHVIRLVDTDGSEKIEIADKSGDNTFKIDTANNKITLKAAGDIEIQATGNLVLKGNNIKMESLESLNINSGSDGEINASGTLKVKGSVINLN